MGFSHQRQAAARTVLRARATGDPQAIEDAEEAVSGFLDHEDLDDYIATHYPNGLDEQRSSTNMREATRELVAEGFIKELDELSTRLPEPLLTRIAAQVTNQLNYEESVNAGVDEVLRLINRLPEDQRERLHARCDCVPNLGPAHCHLCGREQDRQVPWPECRAVVDAEPLSEVTRITIVDQNYRRAYEGHDLYVNGAELSIQDQGRTLKVLPKVAAAAR